MSNLNRHPVRRAAAGVLATTLTFTGAAIAAGVTPANALVGFNFERLAGLDRYETAAAIALDDATLRSARTVVLASGGERNFPDALTANYLAGDVRGPILLTDPARLPAATRSALTTIAPTRVVIVGGTSAVSASVESQVRALGYTVSRLGGLDRYDTARAVAFSVNDRNRDGVQNNGSDTATVGLDRQGRRTAVLGNGQDFADILAAGPLGYARNFPIAITRPAALAAQTRAVLTDLNVDRVIIVGGTAAVSQAVEDQVRALNGGTEILRLAGQLRFETATKIAAFAYDELGFDQRHINLARSDKFADSLSGGPHAGQDRAPIVLSTPEALTPITRDFIQSKACTLVDGHIFGGTAAISAATEAAAVAAGRDARNCPPVGGATPTVPIVPIVPIVGPNATVTGAPELVSVSPLAGEPTVLEFRFDETVTGAALRELAGCNPTDPLNTVQCSFSAFRLYNAAGDASFPFQASIVGNTVRARFLTSQITGASRAGVSFNAVEDVTGVGNVEGDFALSPTTVAATTVGFAPQLTSVGNYRLSGVIVNGAQQVLVDYTFSSATRFAPGASSDEFFLVGANSAQYEGAEVVSVSGGTTATPAQTVTVRFANDLTSVPQSQLRRGYVEDIITAGGVDEELVLSQRFGNTSGETIDPDLVSVTRRSATQYAFTFDEAVSAVEGELVANGFNVVAANGEVTPATTVGRSALAGDEARVVIATFASLPESGTGTPSDAFILQSAVRGTDQTQGVLAGFNRPAQQRLVLPAPTTTVLPAGVTALPDLLQVGVSKNAVTGNFTAAFTFDGNVCAVAEDVAFDLYDVDGTQFRVSNVTSSSAGVTCYTTGTGANTQYTIAFSLDNGATGFDNDRIQSAVTGGVEDEEGRFELRPSVTEGQVNVTAGIPAAAAGSGLGIGDVTPPAFVSSSPANGAAGVAVTSNLTGTFNETLANTSTATLTQGGSVIAGVVSVAGSVITFDPAVSLTAGTSYALTFNVRDPSGNNRIVGIGFTTA